MATDEFQMAVSIIGHWERIFQSMRSDPCILHSSPAFGARHAIEANAVRVFGLPIAVDGRMASIRLRWRLCACRENVIGINWAQHSNAPLTVTVYILCACGIFAIDVECRIEIGRHTYSLMPQRWIIPFSIFFSTAFGVARSIPLCEFRINFAQCLLNQKVFQWKNSKCGGIRNAQQSRRTYSNWRGEKFKQKIIVPSFRSWRCLTNQGPNDLFIYLFICRWQFRSKFISGICLLSVEWYSTNWANHTRLVIHFESNWNCRYCVYCANPRCLCIAGQIFSQFSVMSQRKQARRSSFMFVATSSWRFLITSLKLVLFTREKCFVVCKLLCASNMAHRKLASSLRPTHLHASPSAFALIYAVDKLLHREAACRMLMMMWRPYFTSPALHETVFATWIERTCWRWRCIVTKFDSFNRLLFKFFRQLRISHTRAKVKHWHEGQPSQNVWIAVGIEAVVDASAHKEHTQTACEPKSFPCEVVQCHFYSGNFGWFRGSSISFSFNARRVILSSTLSPCLSVAHAPSPPFSSSAPPFLPFSIRSPSPKNCQTTSETLQITHVPI